MKRASIAGFALICCVFAAVTSGAQINAAPPSVTSMGFGGHPFSGVSPSVTSLGPRGYTPGWNPAFPNSRVIGGARPNVPSNNHHPHHRDGGYGGGVYAVPYYGYYEDGNGDQPADDAEDDQYNGGPTIFDRRGPGHIARPPSEDYADRQPTETATVTSPPDSSPEPPQAETVLVFKDGHQLEVENYAIVGPTLYYLTEGHRRRIGLSELDLVATTKQNDDRGIDFRVPSVPQ
ncbi:MAG: hypothetical protein WB952_09920 [Terriglobales bacterium]